MKLHKTTRHAAVAATLLTGIAAGWWLLATNASNKEINNDRSDVQTATPVVPVSNPATKEELMNKARNVAQKKELLFVQNSGQVKDDHGSVRSDIDFTAESGNIRLYLDAGRISYVFTQHEEAKPTHEETTEQELSDHNHTHSATGSIKVWRMDMEVVGAAANATVTASDTAMEIRNYYVAGKSVQDVRTFRTVVYHSIYPKIDLRLRSSGKRMKYEFIIHPGGNAEDIQLRYNGGKATAMGDGSLRVENPLGYIVEDAPVTYQTADPLTGSEAAEPVESRFILKENTVRFGIGSYDHSKTLVIDPDVLWATLYGGTDSDEEYEGGVCAIDGNGNVIFGGNTLSTDFPVAAGAFQSTKKGSYDAAIVKMSPIGKRIWATYIGGTAEDWVHGVAINSNNDIYLSGHTDVPSSGADFPVGGGSAQQTTRPGVAGDRDAWLMKMNTNGGKIWATFFGGADADDAYGLTVDPSGNPIITGFTGSTGYISTDNTTLVSGIDMYVSKFTSAGAQTWGTYLGGTGALTLSGSPTEESYDIAASASRVAITGWTSSGDLPLAQPTKVFQNTNSTINAFVAIYDNPNTQTPTLQWTTYLGGASETVGYGVILDGNNPIVTGYTESSNFPVNKYITGQNLLQGGMDAFVTKLVGDLSTINNGSQQLLWSTLLGGSGVEIGFDPVLDAQGKVWVAGWTTSTDFPITGTDIAQPYNSGGADAFLVQINQSGTNLQEDWGTYYGGCENDYGTALTSHNGNLVMIGQSQSKDFPTTLGAFQPSLNGTQSDLFVVKFGTPSSDWATFLGSVGTIGSRAVDDGNGIATDPEGNVIVVGKTNGSAFPTTVGVYQTNYQGKVPYFDAFVAKFSPTGQRIWATYYGGSGFDEGKDVGVDDQGNIVMVGATTSPNLNSSSLGAFGYKGGTDAFIADFSPNGALKWASYFGDNGNDIAYGVAVVSDGTIGIVGETSPGTGNIPRHSTYGHKRDRQGGTDAFAAKFDRVVDGAGGVSRNLLWSTYYGGSGNDFGYNIAMDGAGNTAITGITYSTDFDISSGVLQTSQGGGDADAFAVVFKKETDGSDKGIRKWGTYLGGSGEDQGNDVAIDRNGDIVVVGQTISTNFPITSGAFQPTIGATDGDDGFITKIAGATGASLVWSTYLGGTDVEAITGVAIDPLNNIFCTGYAYATWGIPSMSGEIVGNYEDQFILGLTPDGFPVWGKFQGGSVHDRGLGIAVDATGSIVTTGFTNSSGPSSPIDFPVTPGAFDETHNSPHFRIYYHDAFATKNLRSNISQVSTYYGGGASTPTTTDDDDFGNDIALDGAGNIVIAGYSITTDLPRTVGAGARGGFDAIIAKFDAKGRLRWSTYFGGSGDDIAHSLTTDANNDVIVGGYTTTTNNSPNPLQLVQPTQPNYGGGATDGFLLKLDGCGGVRWSTYYGGAGDDAIHSIAIGKNNGNGGKLEDIIVVGNTNSMPIPALIPGPLMTTPPTPPAGVTPSGNLLNLGLNPTTPDAFVARFSPIGMPRWAAYHGGSMTDHGNGVAVRTIQYPQPVGAKEVICAVGHTISPDLPLAGNWFQNVLVGYFDIWFAAITDNAGGMPAVLQYSSYYGGHDIDEGQDIVIDGNGNLAFTGATVSFDFPVSFPPNPNQATAFQPFHANVLSYDAVVVKFNAGPNPATWNRLWGTYFGGANLDYGYAIAADANNDLLVGGSTSSTNFPVAGTGTLQKTYRGGVSDGFVAKFGGGATPAPPSGQPIWSGYLGGRAWEGVGGGVGAPIAPPRGGIATDPANNLYIVSTTLSPDFPVSLGGYRRTAIAEKDIAITKMKGDGTGVLKMNGDGGTQPAMGAQPLPATEFDLR